ncbi:energy transducer TonB [Geobacter pelophilus]|uniref:Energy transducer TonB n=1 Tax=Geoanaerobacter pelophilus TaxID=60036 RepID=A0AAW4LCK3_9BACT|nr:TonB C-terminal domain-containing protein [Geoanaerobacter pelophilus]MBT0666141.1 energy transducer TonB [Geoanaerobacter pelophilus]
MASKKTKKKQTDIKGIATVAVICAVILVAVGLLLKVMLSDSGSIKKPQIATVTLLKPPPPPEVKEKPPEPEVLKQQEQKMETPMQAPQDAPQNNQPADSAPPGADLGVDAAGGAGSDGFGLVGRKGGRSIIGGGSGGTGGGGMSRVALLTKYGWYTKKVQDEIWGNVKKVLDKDGGIPKGKYKTLVWLQLDPKGSVTQFRIVNPSGNDKIDQAIRQAMAGIRITEPPPDGMPNAMTVRVSSQG